MKVSNIIEGLGQTHLDYAFKIKGALQVWQKSLFIHYEHP
jgi:hypothetical protein